MTAQFLVESRPTAAGGVIPASLFLRRTEEIVSDYVARDDGDWFPTDRLVARGQGDSDVVAILPERASVVAAELWGEALGALTISIALDPMLLLAAGVAREAHRGQVDKSGLDYLQHPRRVASRVSGVDAIAVALLHDVVEDSAWTLDQLRDHGFPEHVVAAVDALSKRPGEALEESIARVNADPLARLVKYADVADNSDPARLALLDPELRERLTTKYRRTRELLDSAADGGGPQLP